MFSSWGFGDDAGNDDLANIDWTANENDPIFKTSPPANSDLLAVDPRQVRRAETAPMVLTMLAADGSLCVGSVLDDAAPGEEYRYSEDYHRLYYSKMPRDPRMLPPLTRHRPAPAPAVVMASSSTNGADTTAGVARSTSNSVSNVAAATTPAFSVGAVGEKVTPDVGDASLSAAHPLSSTATPAAVPSSQKSLMEFRLQEYLRAGRPAWGYAEISGMVYSFVLDQDGSRLVQRVLDNAVNIAPVFDELSDKFDELMADAFGNYVMQKLFEVVSKMPEQREDEAASRTRMLSRLLHVLEGNVKKFSYDMYGCRAIQKALEYIPREDAMRLIHELDQEIAPAVIDHNANHVIQRVVELYPSESQFIVDAFIEPLQTLACHTYGCRVLQCIFESCHDVPRVDLQPLLKAVLAIISDLTIHQYGNYVVQHALLNAPKDIRRAFMTHLIPQVFALSCSKFASNVAEKVVLKADESERDAILTQLTLPLSDTQGGSYIVQMMQDAYANYVVQHFLSVASPEQRARVGKAVVPHILTINKSVYGRHLLRKMENLGIFPSEYLQCYGIDVTTSDYGGANGQHSGSGGGRSAAHANTRGGGSRRHDTRGERGDGVASASKPPSYNSLHLPLPPPPPPAAQPMGFTSNMLAPPAASGYGFAMYSPPGFYAVPPPPPSMPFAAPKVYPTSAAISQLPNAYGGAGLGTAVSPALMSGAVPPRAAPRRGQPSRGGTAQLSRGGYAQPSRASNRQTPSASWVGLGNGRL